MANKKTAAKVVRTIVAVLLAALVILTLTAQPAY